MPAGGGDGCSDEWVGGRISGLLITSSHQNFPHGAVASPLPSQIRLLCLHSMHSSARTPCAETASRTKPPLERNRPQQRINESLVALMSPGLHPEQRAKLDTERVRRLFLLYCSRLRRAMMSPRYCYFSGFAAVAPRLIARLKEQVRMVWGWLTVWTSGVLGCMHVGRLDW